MAVYEILNLGFVLDYVAYPVCFFCLSDLGCGFGVGHQLQCDFQTIHLSGRRQHGHRFAVVQQSQFAVPSLETVGYMGESTLEVLL